MSVEAKALHMLFQAHYFAFPWAKRVWQKLKRCRERKRGLNNVSSKSF